MRVQSAAVTPHVFRQACSLFATGVTVISTEHDDVRVGLTVNSFSSVSMDPPLVLWSLRTHSRSRAYFENAGRFSVSVLSARQRDVALRFASGSDDAYAQMPDVFSGNGLPLIGGALAHMDCTVRAVHEAGDHLIFIGEVVDLAVHGGAPLLFFAGALSNSALSSSPVEMIS